MLYTDNVEVQKDELESIIQLAMDRAHHLFARMWRLQQLLSAEYDIESTPQHLTHARSIAAHLIAQHEAECRRSLHLLDELAHELPAKLVG